MKHTVQTQAGTAILHRMRTTIRGYMLRGILVLVPIGVTAYVLMLVYRFTAGLLAPLIRRYLMEMPPYAVTALSVFLFLAMLYTIGLAAAVVVGRRFIGLGEAILHRIPLVRTVYSASKQVVDVFSRDDATAAYQAAVVVGFPSPDIQCLAFVTGKMTIEGEGEFYRIFVPTAPNPTSGYLEIMPVGKVRETTLSVEEAFRAVMSLGILIPDRIQTVNGDPLTSTPCASQGLDTGSSSKRAKQSDKTKHGLGHRVMGILRRRILSGFLVLVPLGVTAFILDFAYRQTAGRIAPFAEKLIAPVSPIANAGPMAVVLASIVLLLALLYLTGFIATAVVGGRLIRAAEQIIERIPLVTTVYGATKQIMQTALQQDGEPALQDPAIVEFPYVGARSVGFIVGTVDTSDGETLVKVLIPTVPNISVGLIQLIPPRYVYRCGLNVESALKLAVSCGLIGPDSVTLVPFNSLDASREDVAITAKAEG